MSSVSVGKDKRSMFIVGENMIVCDVCRLFGSYVKLHIEDSQDCRAPTNTGPDAFAVLMANQRLLCSPKLPDLRERTGQAIQ